MKIAISAMGETLEDNTSEVFARSPYFIIAEVENKEIKSFEAVKNESENQMGGAGISASKFVSEKNVNAVITGNVGPRAADVFKQFKIEVYQGNGPIKEVLEKFIKGELKKL
jgi:predicted Fe-Mo cluster-binding NifX family protein